VRRLALAVCLFAAAQSADAAWAHNDFVDYDGSTLEYAQYPGLTPSDPTNTLTVTFKSDSTGDYFVFKDPTSTGITNRSPCVPLDPGDFSVRCPSAGVTRLLIDTGTGNDSATVNAATPTDIYGGPGHDGITGGTGPTNVYGQAGDDTLVAGADGGATLDGGTGSNSLRAQNGAVDTVTYCDGVDSPPLVDAFDGITAACPTTDVDSPIQIAPFPPPPTTGQGGGGGSGGSTTGGGGSGSGAAQGPIHDLRMVPRRFRAVQRRGASIAGATSVGTTVAYGATAGGGARFSIARRTTTKRRVHWAAAGSFSRHGRAGQNRFRFTGRIRGRPLRSGRYRLTVRAAAGGDALTMTFRIVR
jgi:hypothetical protein